MPLAAAIYFALSSTAFAQDAGVENEPETDAPAQAQPASKKKATTLGTVTVSAQKREENLQKVPISIDAIGAVKLEALNITDFGKAMAILPAVSFDTGEGGSTHSLHARGGQRRERKPLRAAAQRRRLRR